jgi:hypothetical protein
MLSEVIHYQPDQHQLDHHPQVALVSPGEKARKSSIVPYIE